MSEAQRIGPGNCLTKTQGCANSKDDVYSLTPARCRKVKRRCHSQEPPVNGGRNYNGLVDPDAVSTMSSVKL